MSTDAICTCSHGLGVLRHADDCPVAIERRQPVRLAALSAPSEPAAKINESEAALAADAAHQHGFDHGRRWAAEEVLRFAAEENRAAHPSWLRRDLGENRLAEVAAAFGRRLIRDLEPPAVPSEPVPDGPRVWAGVELPAGGETREEWRVSGVSDDKVYGKDHHWERIYEERALADEHVDWLSRAYPDATATIHHRTIVTFTSEWSEVVEESTP